MYQDKHLLVLGTMPCAHHCIFASITDVSDELMNWLSGFLHHNNRVGIYWSGSSQLLFSEGGLEGDWYNTTRYHYISCLASAIA